MFSKSIEDPAFSVMWHVVVPWMEAHAPNPRGVRATLGKLISQHGRASVLIAFDAAVEAKPRPADPYTYFLAIVNRGDANGRRKNRAEQAWDDFEREHLSGRGARSHQPGLA